MREPRMWQPSLRSNPGVKLLYKGDDMKRIPIITDLASIFMKSKFSDFFSSIALGKFFSLQRLRQLVLHTPDLWNPPVSFDTYAHGADFARRNFPRSMIVSIGSEALRGYDNMKSFQKLEESYMKNYADELDRLVGIEERMCEQIQTFDSYAP